MNSKLTLIIFDVLESLDIPLSDSAMTETCSRQTTPCSRQAGSANTKEKIFFQNIKNYQNQRVGTILHCTLTFTTATSCNMSATSFTGTRIDSQNIQIFQNI